MLWNSTKELTLWEINMASFSVYFIIWLVIYLKFWWVFALLFCVIHNYLNYNYTIIFDCNISVNYWKLSERI